MSALRIAGALRSCVGGAQTIAVQATTIAELRRAIAEGYPELGARVLRDGEFSSFVTVFVDGEDARFIAPDADISRARTIEMLPAMSGGATALARSPLGNAARREIHGSFVDETIGLVARVAPGIISFAVGSPAAEALALTDAAALAAAVLEREGTSALGYGITEGDPELREIVAAAARRRGIRAGAEDVIVTAGALQAIDIACRLFVSPGDLVVTESPGFANALSALRNHGARVLEVPVDEDGIDVAAAERALRARGERPVLFFVVPNFQNPTGATLTCERREALLALARGYGAVVVEDDPYGELRFRGEPLPPLASLGDGVVSIGSFSKTFLPGIRVGWAIADGGTIRRMAAAKQTMDSSTSTLGQRLVVEFHRRGGVDLHLAALRALYRERQERAQAALTREFAAAAEVRWTNPEGGFYLWLRLPAAVSARRLLDAALAEGVAFVPGDAFTIAGDFTSALRFSYSWPTGDRIDEGVRRLRRAYDRVRRDAAPG